MGRRWWAVVAVVALCVAATSAIGGGPAAAATGGYVFDQRDGHLYALDLPTGLLTDLGHVLTLGPASGLGDLAVGCNGHVYGVDLYEAVLYEIDPSVPAVVARTQLHLGNARAIAFDPDGRLWVVVLAGDMDLYVVDIATATDRFVAHLGFSTDGIDGLATSPTGSLYAFGAGHLHLLDPHAPVPSLTRVSAEVPIFLDGLDTDAQGGLWALGRAVGDDAPSLWSIDPVTGEGTERNLYEPDRWLAGPALAPVCAQAVGTTTTTAAPTSTTSTTSTSTSSSSSPVIPSTAPTTTSTDEADPAGAVAATPALAG